MIYLKKFENEEAKKAWMNGSEYATPNVVFMFTKGVVEYNLISYASEPLFIEAIEDLTVSFNLSYTESDNYSKVYEYSKDTVTWQSGTRETVISANAGEKVYFRAKDLYVSPEGMGYFAISNGKCNVGGNVMSMAYGTDFKGKTTITNDGLFENLFKNCSTILDASKLVLPATTLSTMCYSNMFEYCTSLENAPQLPATNLGYGCYSNMFKKCTSLENAPTLPATILKLQCYAQMFLGCSKLNYIKMLATDISEDDECLLAWVDGVSASGTFVKNAAATWDVVGKSGIPEGWTIEYAES